MKIRKKLENKILSNLGNGMLKLICGLVGTGKTSFVFNDLFVGLVSDSNIRVVDTRNMSFDGIKRVLLSYKEIARDKHLVVLIDDIFEYGESDFLFNVVFGKKDVDIISTADFNADFMLGSEETTIRGRYMDIYFPPLSYFDSLNSGFVRNRKEYLVKGGLFISKAECFQKILDKGEKIKKYRGDWKENIRKILQFASSRFGETISFSDVTKSFKNEISRNTLISYFDFLVGANLFYALKRENIKTGNETAYGFVLYPVDTVFFEANKSPFALDKSLLLAKFYEESYRVTCGYVYDQFNGVFQAKNLAYVLRKGKDKIYVAYSDSDGSEEAGALANYIKDSFLKVVVIPVSAKPWQDKNGVLHIGIEQFLQSDIF